MIVISFWIFKLMVIILLVVNELVIKNKSILCRRKSVRDYDADHEREREREREREGQGFPRVKRRQQMHLLLSFTKSQLCFEPHRTAWHSIHFFF